jgi:hypothetical protein
MPARLEVFVVTIGVIICVGIIELVRRRSLREEYSFIWLVTGFSFVLLALDSDVLFCISRLLDIALPVNTLFFLALIFTLLLCLYYSLRISALTTQVKNLAQQLALLEARSGANDSQDKTLK